MMKNRNMFFLVVFILLFMILVLSTSALILSGIEEKSVEVSVVIDDSGSARWAAFMSGLEQAAKDNGVTLNVIPTGKNLTLNQQYNLIKDVIRNGSEGIIWQVTNSRGTASIIADISRKAVLELVDTSAETDLDVEGKFACIEADNIEIGRTIADEVMKALGSDLSGHTIGIIEGNQKQRSNQLRLQGFTEGITDSGAKIVWRISGNIDAEEIRYRQGSERADILVALDDSSLEASSDYVIKTEDIVHLFGEGTSIKNVSYLDDGIITSMVFPDEYYMGYRSLSKVVEKIDNKLSPIRDENISFIVVNRDNLFDEKNQRILFPIVQ